MPALSSLQPHELGLAELGSRTGLAAAGLCHCVGSSPVSRFGVLQGPGVPLIVVLARVGIDQ